MISNDRTQPTEISDFSRYGHLLSPTNVSLLVLCIAVTVYFGNTYRLHVERWDDAYITFRFAQHLAEGHGLIWNLGGEPVEGFTSILHVLILAAGIKLGIEPWWGSLFIGVVSVLVTVCISVIIAWRYLGALRSVFSIILGIFLIDSITAVHTTSGLETQLFVAILAVCVLLSLAFIQTPRWSVSIGLGVAIVLSCLARPEAVIFGFGIYIALAVYSISNEIGAHCVKSRLIKLAVSTGVVALTGLMLGAWKLNYFGYLFPNPFYVKSNEFSFVGIQEVLDFFLHLAKWLAPVVIATIAVIAINRWRNQVDRSELGKSNTEYLPEISTSKFRAIWMVILTGPLLATIYYSTVIHEVGGAHRFSYPTYIYFVLAVSLPISMFTPLNGLTRRLEWAVFLVALCWFGTLFVWQKSWHIEPVPESAFGQYHRKIANALRDTGLRSKGTILCDAAGIIPYISGFNQVDRVGLVDNLLSGRDPMTASAREEYIWSRPLDVYVGYEPPATDGALRSGDDPIMNSQYVSKILLKRKLTLVEDRIFLQDPEALHQRMRELRDNWMLVGEIEWPGWEAWQLKSFVYVRQNSSYVPILVPKLKEIVMLGASELNFNDVSEERFIR